MGQIVYRNIKDIHLLENNPRKISVNEMEKLDAYVGEIFPNTYKIEYQMLKEIFERHNCGRIAVFRNHSKYLRVTEINGLSA